MQIIDLNGQWELFPCPPEKDEIISVAQLKKSGIVSINARVPGNIELDLAAAGLTPSDPFYAMNPEAFRKFENHDWFYLREFEVPADFPECTELCLDAVDCFTEIFINGELTATTDNALIPHRIPVKLRKGKRNEIAIRILSANQESFKRPAEAGEWPQNANVFNRNSIRKSAHCWGWDITPRFICGGIWRDIRIESVDEYRIDPVFVRTDPASFPGGYLKPESNSEIYTVNEENPNAPARLHIFYQFHIPPRSGKAAALRFYGKCGDSTFYHIQTADSTSGYFSFSLTDPKRWDVNGYGKQNLYDLHTELVDENCNILAQRDDRFGIRTISFDPDICRFYVNGHPVRIHGVNWSPADAFHSRIPLRQPELLAAISELNCNMVRCWGGGVYENEEFFNYCDEHGILVWQDFGMACSLYPQKEPFISSLRKEAEAVITRLRRHPSLAIWCGDNECDQFYVELFRSPQENILTRQVLPQCLFRLDPDRPYVPSSPAVTKAVIHHGMPPQDPENIFATLPERHLWGSRIDFRSDFYNPRQARFIGETGWHGSPSYATLTKFLSPSSLRVDFDNVQWILHGSDAFRQGGYYSERPHIMRRNLQHYFGFVPNDLQEFVFGSQLFHLEALRYIVQQARLRPEINGFLWWNLTDCWPAFSESIMDYFNERKPAFFMLRELYKSFAVMITDNGTSAVNDTGKTVNGKLFWKCADKNDSGIHEFSIAPGVHEIDLVLPESDLILLNWESDAGSGVNHRLKDLPRADWDFCRRFWPEIARFSGIE